MRVGNKRFLDFYLFTPKTLANFRKPLVWKHYGKISFQTISHHLKHWQSLQAASIRPATAMNGCQLHYQFTQDCYHCTEERRKKKSAMPGKARSATFSIPLDEFPPPCLFAGKSMKNGKNFEDFTLWHSFQRKNYEATSSVNNFRQELIEYCRSDVTLLRKWVSEFRRLIRRSCQNIDPFQVACTADSACN